MKTIPYGRQDITDEDIQAVAETLKSDFLTQGPKILEFEENFAEYAGAKHAVAVSNGTAALHLAAMALSVKSGDKVITTPITFVASANGFRYCGAEIAFCDIDPETFLIDLDKLEKMLSSVPAGTYSGVVPVDFAGYPVHAEKLRKIADKYGLWIVEDACHAPGGWFIDDSGEKNICGNGKYSDITVFSFHPVKHIATGEGGALTTNNSELYRKLNLYRTHGITKNHELLEQNDGRWYYEMQELGYNYRITDFQATLGIQQLKRLDWSLKRRNEIANRYNNAFADVKKIKTPFTGENIFHAYHLYVIQTDNRKGLYDYLHAANILAQVHYVPCHLMPYYKQFGWKRGDMPIAENYYDHCLSLPMYPTLTNEEQNYVIEKIRNFVK
ncbi:MAG: UDP-4-amino-4,6-dideoxy-N-acetyl-beta-L-altrosamine transaminase [Prevotellaceae bacterium]|jgi:UDP-4-amino-4,6-dideoxy-N-acetyl-beta-L-altrosamine transaminase|nr:UDP-4-amino-4,6-dideoxy-N-acetyl-beta-L-altrosamine transaminase [Prevotellaceae bacterium]